MDAWVIFSSVRRGVISDRDPMKVVLPTAKCPTTRIFAAVVTSEETYMEPFAPGSADVEGFESMQNLLEYRSGNVLGGGRFSAAQEVPLLE
jgi:hypothetical protein